MDNAKNGAYEVFDRLIELTEEKIGLLEKLIRIAHKQESLINEESVEQFQDSLDERQKFISEVDRLDKQYEEYFMKAKELLGVDRLDQAGNLPANASRLKAVTAQVYVKLKVLEKLDAENQKKAEALMDQIKDKMKEISMGKKMTKGYYPYPAQTTSNYFDKKVGK